MQVRKITPDEPGIASRSVGNRESENRFTAEMAPNNEPKFVDVDSW